MVVETHIDPTEPVFDLPERRLDRIFGRNVASQTEGFNFSLLRLTVRHWTGWSVWRATIKDSDPPNQSTRSFAAASASSSLRSIRTILSAPLSSVSLAGITHQWTYLSTNVLAIMLPRPLPAPVTTHTFLPQLRSQDKG